jgi:hypothetical protein
LGGASAAPTLICLITAVKIHEQRDQEIYLQIFRKESQMEIGSTQIFQEVMGDSARKGKKRPRIAPEPKEGGVSFFYSA